MTGRLVKVAKDVLAEQGHHVLESDLYGMRWKAVFDADDFPERLDPRRLSFIHESGNAFDNGTQTPDVAAEQAKLLAADAVVLVFPLWWFSMPAILKGWVDRVFAYGLAYGYQGAGNTYRYGEGGFAGKRALVAVTVGGSESDYSPRGINGDMDELLFPITHGMLFFPGMDVLPPFAVYGAVQMPDEAFATTVASWRHRLEGLFDDAPIPFRPQNAGDYPDRHVLADGVAAGTTGLRVHVATSSPSSQRERQRLSGVAIEADPE